MRHSQPANGTAFRKAVHSPLLHFAYLKALARSRMPVATTARKITAALLAATLACNAAIASELTITQEDLLRQPELPADLSSRPYPDRVDWLQQALASSDNPARRYQLSRELAITHNEHYANDKVRPICRDTPPLPFDLFYRLLCLEGEQYSYEDSIRRLLALYNDAMAANNAAMAATALSSVAWKQSSNGDIADAFRNYERALVLAEKASPESLYAIMVDTATLYVMHGDQDYIQKGIQLQQAAIARLEALKATTPEANAYANDYIQLVQHNIGIAYALHLYDYTKALEWFDRVKLDETDLARSTLVFSALSAAELGDTALTKAKLAASYQAAKSTQANTDYLDCYQQLVKMKLNQPGELQLCRHMPSVTPLEVLLDVYKRMATMTEPDWRLTGLEKLHELYISKLEPQLKLSSTQAASHAELSRLQMESKLKSELLEKEQALNEAEKEKRRTQTMLMVAASTILLLIILVIAIQLRQNRRLARQYESLSVRDGLTGLNNRRYFEQNIERELNFVKRSQQDGTGHSLAIYLFDIDHFKRINDTHGHDAGDAVIIEFGRRIQTAIRETDMLIRWGGEEFLLVARIQRTDEHHHIAERIRSVIAEQPFQITKAISLNVTCTIGGVIYPYADQQDAKQKTVPWDWNKLVQLADAALYYGKRKQRNAWVCVDNVLAFDQIDTILSQNLELSMQQQLIAVSSQFDPSPTG